MITLTTPITPAPQIWDGVWIKSLNISAPSATQPVRATVILSPFSSATGVISPNFQTINIADVYALASTDTNIAQVMTSLFAYVQSQVTAGTIVFS